MSISVPDNPDISTHHLADAIMYATEHGASVINIPWFSLYPSALIYDAIAYALAEGRNGKGCVVVCGAGNYNNFPKY